MESLAPALVDDMELLVDLLPADTHVLVLDPERVRDRAHDLVATSEEFLGRVLGGRGRRGGAPIDLGAASYRELADVRAHASSAAWPWWSGEPVRARRRAADDVDGRRSTSALPASGRAPTAATSSARVADIRGWRAEATAVVVVHPGHGPAQRMVEVLGEHDVPARLVELGTVGPVDGVVTVTVRPARPRLRRRRRAARGAHRRRPLRPEGLHPRHAEDADPAQEADRPARAEAGDYVVHEQHGVGRFVEMKQREVQGATREYLVLEYGASKRGGPPDRLYVPADALDQVTRYVGGEQPSLDRLGGATGPSARAAPARRSARSRPS